MALWDLKAKAAGVPLFRLLGGARSSATFFDPEAALSGVDVADAVTAARKSMDAGALGVSVQVGCGDVQQDADRVQQIRDGVGESAWLGVFADGRYDLGTALAMAHFYEEDVGIDWFDTPIPVDDRLGYQRLAERMEVPLACGATFNNREEFRRILDEGAVRVLRPDPQRLGGLTPLIKIAAMAEAFHVAVVPCTPAELGVQVACGLPNVPMFESGNGLSRLFGTSPNIKGGRMSAPNLPGLGVQLDKTALEQYRVG